MGFSPIGAFNLDLGPETPAVYLLVPSTNLESLVKSELQLAKDEEFMKAAAPTHKPGDGVSQQILLLGFGG